MADTSAVIVTVTLLVTFVSLSLVTTAVNVAVMGCIMTEKKLHTTSGLYMFSLAVVDGIVGILVMPAMTVYTVYGMWPLSQFLCTVWVCIDFVCCTVSMLHFLLLAHDRFRAIYRPMQYSQISSVSSYALNRIAWAWMVGVGVWLPIIFYYRAVYLPVELDCFYTPTPLYVVIQASLVYYIPLVLIMIIYTACVNRLRQRFRTIAGTHQVQQPSAMVTTGTAATTSTAADPYTLQLEKEQQRRRRHVRRLRLLGILLLAFLVCWLPFSILWPISAYCPDCISTNAYQYSYWSAYINSTINPILYFCFHRDFRNAFRLMWGKMFPSCSSG